MPLMTSWVELSQAESSWVELSQAESIWVKLSWAEMIWVKLSQAELIWVNLCQAESSWVESNWVCIFCASLIIQFFVLKVFKGYWPFFFNISKYFDVIIEKKVWRHNMMVTESSHDKLLVTSLAFWWRHVYFWLLNIQ